jgi:hypothetical protein
VRTVEPLQLISKLLTSKRVISNFKVSNIWSRNFDSLTGRDRRSRLYGPGSYSRAKERIGKIRAPVGYTVSQNVPSAKSPPNFLGWSKETLAVG